VALGPWQLTNCTRPGLPGHGLRIWDLKLHEEGEHTPVSNTCLPNEVVLATGPFRLQEGEDQRWELRLLPHELHAEPWQTCRGCPLADEKAEGVLQRLLEEAESRRAQMLEPDQLMARYGLQLDARGTLERLWGWVTSTWDSLVSGRNRDEDPPTTQVTGR
jgi:hypothetical protein